MNENPVREFPSEKALGLESSCKSESNPRLITHSSSVLPEGSVYSNGTTHREMSHVSVSIGQAVPLAHGLSISAHAHILKPQ